MTVFIVRLSLTCKLRQILLGIKIASHLAGADGKRVSDMRAIAGQSPLRRNSVSLYQFIGDTSLLSILRSLLTPLSEFPSTADVAR
jgi:hypothetical protein